MQQNINNSKKLGSSNNPSWYNNKSHKNRMFIKRKSRNIRKIAREKGETEEKEMVLRFAMGIREDE